MYQRSWIKKSQTPSKKTTRKVNHLAFYLWGTLFLVSFFAFVYFARRDEYQITQIVVTNAFITEEATVRQVSSDILAQKYLYLIPKSNFYFYPKRVIGEEILKLPSVLAIDLNLDRSSHTLYIDIKDKEHEFLWCRGESDCFYMDRNGYIFAQSPMFEGSIFVRFEGLVTGEPVGAYFMSEAKLKSVLDFVASLSDLKFNVRSVNALSENEIILELASKPYLTISLEDDLKVVLRNFQTLIASKDFLTATGGIDRISKLDLRYGTKGFWVPKQ